jgi:malic enzyme
VHAFSSPFKHAQTCIGNVNLLLQANNVYIFPALGFAAVAVHAQQLTDEMFVVAAEELAGMTTLDDVEAGRCACAEGCALVLEMIVGFSACWGLLASRVRSAAGLAFSFLERAVCPLLFNRPMQQKRPCDCQCSIRVPSS